METLYIVCMIIGIALPFISLLLGVFDGMVDFFSIDLFSGDGFDFDTFWLPLSSNSISMGLLIFGALGLLMQGHFLVWQVNVIGGISGYVCAMLTQLLIKTLKKQKHLASNTQDIINRIATVSNTINKNGFGAISLCKEDASVVTCPAKATNGKRITQGTKVKVVRFENSYAVVYKIQEKKGDKKGE